MSAPSFCAPGLELRGWAGLLDQSLFFGGADTVDGKREFAFWQRVGDKFVSALPQKRMQGGRSDIFGDQDDLDVAGLGLCNDLGHQDEVFLIGLIKSQRNEFHRICFRLTEEGQRLCKTQIAPTFAEDVFHVFDQQIEVLNVTAHRTSNDWRCFGLRHNTTHSLIPLNARGWQRRVPHLACRVSLFAVPLAWLVTQSEFSYAGWYRRQVGREWG